ncbi:MAG: S8 family serine peptidase [Flavobacteriaceae bacterium]
MKKIVILLGCLWANFTLNAQENAWVYLTDKQDVSTKLANPISILSQDAIDRKTAQNIEIDERDVPVNENYIEQLKAATGITVMAKSKWFNAVHVQGSLGDIGNLSNLNFVSAIDYANRSLNSKQVKQKAESKFQKTNTVFDYGNAVNQIEMVSIDQLHEADFTGSGVTVAVLDNGFLGVNTIEAFQRLRNANNIKGTYDFVGRVEDVYTYTTGGKRTNHGTGVLSTMAAYIDGEYVGTAPDAAYYLFITEDNSSETPVEESYWVEAAERADSLGVDVINTSLGYKYYTNPNYSYSDADMDGNTAFITKGANIAFQKGLLLVNSAGNDGSRGLNAPADSKYVFTIGSVNISGEYFSGSSTGSEMLSYIKPDVMALGHNTSVINDNNTITSGTGTSFASPIIAGGMACLKQALPNKSNAEIMQLVRQSASRYTNPDYQYGYGIPDFWQAYSATLSMENDNLNNSVVLYPNPTSHSFVVNGVLQNNTISIYNTLGKLVLSLDKYANNAPIDISVLPSGIYFVEVENESQSKALKLIKY